ncbi:hypothetical protein ACFV1L_29725 [Kitasatospora sp. NPDC059646]|uniref:hypothetical protein n=1 Tax=Kitasatospora sp. NPDC059646 TaxID=3346893 RepID=UPI0036C8B86C
MQRRVIAPTPDSPASHAVGIDFDDTLAAHDRGWQNGLIYGQPIPGAIEALRLLADHRAVFVCTARPDSHLAAVADWVTRHSGLPALVDTSRARSYWLERGLVLVTNRKLGAARYVDDRAVAFTGDWAEALTAVAQGIGLPPDALPRRRPADGRPHTSH